MSLEYSPSASLPRKFLPFAQEPDKKHFPWEALSTSLGQNCCWLLPLGPDSISFMLYENPNSSQALDGYLGLGPSHP